jgi:hypothetical protein
MNEGLVSLEQCLEALRDQKRNGGDLGTAFVRLGFLKDDEILSVLSVAYGIPSIRLDGRYCPAAQARPSAIGPAGISRSTFHSTRSMTATWPLASQDT